MSSWTKVIGVSCALLLSARQHAGPDTGCSFSIEGRDRADHGRCASWPVPGAAEYGDAGGTSHQASRGRVAAHGTSQRITRKNLIDEHLFGRMERDGVPHVRSAAMKNSYAASTSIPPGSFPRLKRFANSWRTAILANATC